MSLRGWAGGPGRHGHWIQGWIMSPTSCVTRASHRLSWRDPTAYVSPLSCLRWPDLAPVWPEVQMTWMIEQMAQEPRAPWYLSTHVAHLAKWHVEPWEQQKGCGISRWLRNHQIAAESTESCGMPVNMSKSKQNSHTLANLTWSCLMTSNVMIWVVLHGKWGERER